MNARVERQSIGSGWNVFFDGWRTGFATESSARSAARRFETGATHPRDYFSHRVLPYSPEPHDQDAYNAGDPAPHTAPMTHTAAMAHKIADLEAAMEAARANRRRSEASDYPGGTLAATHIGTTVAAELHRWREIDRAARFGGEAWHDATRRLRDVADRLGDVAVVDDAGVTS